MSCRTGSFLLAGALLTLSNCSGGGAAADPAAPGTPRTVGPYFDVRGLLDAQVQQLAARHPGVTKQVSARGSAPETVRVPQVKWADELQIFYQATALTRRPKPMGACAALTPCARATTKYP